MKLLVIILVTSLTNSQWSGDGSGGWNDDDEGSGEDEDDYEGSSGDNMPLGEEDLEGQGSSGERGYLSQKEDSFEEDSDEDAYIEEEYEAALNSYSEEIHDDTTVEVSKKIVNNITKVSKDRNRKPHRRPSIDVTIRKLVDTNSGQSSRINCFLLILTLTVHWMLLRFSMSRRRPRRVIQIRRPTHLH